MIEKGYYIKARQIQSSEIMRQPPHVRETWDWLLMNANHKPTKYNGFIINRGQLFRTYRDIIEGLSWYVGWRKMTYNENQMKASMKFLRKAGMITTTKALGGVLITIVKYDFFQDPKAYENPKETPEENPIEHPREHQTLPNNNKNDKNVKNDKKKGLKPFVDTSDEVRLSEKLLAFILEKNPNHKKPDIQSWARHVDLMLRVDKRQVEQIETVIDWCQSDSFWQNNILSTKKLREKFDQLFLKMNNGNGQHQSKYDHNMAVAKRMINKAREEKDKNEPRKRLQSPWDAFDCIPGQENE